MQLQFLVKLQSNCKFVCGLVVDMVLVLYCVWLLLLFFGTLLCVDVVADGCCCCVGGVAR
jgi:hypothetical protein